VITSRILTPEGLKEVDLDDAPEGAILWVDVLGRDPAEIQPLAERYRFHPLAVEDCLSAHQRPKLDDYGDHLFMVFYGLGDSPDEDDDEEVDAFLRPHLMVTVRNGQTTNHDAVIRRLTNPPEGCRSGFIAWALMDEVVDNYFVVVDKLEDDIDALEEAVFEDERPPDLQRRIYAARKQLIRVRRRVTPMRDILSALMTRPEISKEVLPYLQDVYDHVLRITDTIDTLRDLVSSAHDSYLTIVSNDMNRVMKRFTSLGAILVSATLVAGVYGMNFEHMPELHWAFGYPLALGTMALITVGLWIYFKRRDYL
jgi:magnesium transporter